MSQAVEIGCKPDYHGTGIVNLMSSIALSLGADASPGYPPLSHFELPLQSGPLVLLVVDGLGYDYVQARSQPGLFKRHTEARLTSVCPSTTASAITTFMTGQAPQQHGLTGWFMYFREIGSVLAVLPFAPRHGGGLSEAAFDARQLLRLQPFAARLPVPVQHILPAYIADSQVSRAFRGGADTYPYRDLSGFTGLVERAVKSSRGRRFIYAYWAEFDAMSHHYGASSREVAEHYQGLEFSLAAMLGRLQGSGATILVTADHGFVDCTPEQCVFLSDHPRLEAMLQLPLCGEPRFAYCYLKPGSEQAFDAYVSGMEGVRACVDSQLLLDEGWFGLGARHPRLAERIGQRVLVMEPGWQIKDQLLGQRAHCQLGLHGGPTEAEMYVPLIVLPT